MKIAATLETVFDILSNGQRQQKKGASRSRSVAWVRSANLQLRDNVWTTKTHRWWLLCSFPLENSCMQRLGFVLPTRNLRLCVSFLLHAYVGLVVCSLFSQLRLKPLCQFPIYKPEDGAILS